MIEVVRIEKDASGWWKAFDANGVALVARRSKKECTSVAADHVRIYNAVEEIALRYMAGEIEGRIPAVAAIERIPGVRDVFEARFLLDRACEVKS